MFFSVNNQIGCNMGPTPCCSLNEFGELSKSHGINLSHRVHACVDTVVYCVHGTVYNYSHGLFTVICTHSRMCYDCVDSKERVVH